MTLFNFDAQIKFPGNTICCLNVLILLKREKVFKINYFLFLFTFIFEFFPQSSSYCRTSSGVSFSHSTFFYYLSDKFRSPFKAGFMYSHILTLFSFSVHSLGKTFCDGTRAIPVDREGFYNHLNTWK